MKSCINGVNFIRLLCLLIKLLKFEIQKCGQILCAHKPCFLIPGHKCSRVVLLYHHTVITTNIFMPLCTILCHDLYVLLKALPPVCMKYTARGESRVANIARGEAECYICHETLTKCCIFHTNKAAVL